MPWPFRPLPQSFRRRTPRHSPGSRPFPRHKNPRTAKLDECRRRVHNDTLGHREPKTDPAFRTRRLSTKAHERLDEKGDSKLAGLLAAAGDPNRHVRTAWHANQVVRSIYDISDAALAETFVCESATDLQDQDHPVEVQSLGRTLARWFEEITNWHKASVSNGPTESVNNLIKRIKRIGFGFRTFNHYRIRVLLYAGKPNWHLLPTTTPRLNPKRHHKSMIRASSLRRWRRSL